MLSAVLWTAVPAALPGADSAALDDLISHWKNAEALAMLKAHPELLNQPGVHSQTPLILASQECNPNLVAAILTLNPKLDLQDFEAQTALIRASKNGSLPIVKLLVAKGANIDLKDQNGLTAEAMARDRNNLDIAQYLHDEEVRRHPETITDPGSGEDFLTAVANYHTSIALGLLAREPALVNAVNTQGQTGLMIAAKLALPPLVTAILAQHPDLHLTDPDGKTVVHYAVEGNNLDILKAVVAAGADPRTRDKAGQTPEEEAISLARQPMADYLKEAEAVVPATVALQADLRAAITNDKPANVQSILAAHPEQANARDDKRFTPLILAASCGQTDLIDPIISAGADIDAQDGDGMSALHHAAKNGLLATINAMLAHNPNIGLVDNNRQTAEDLARANNHADCADRLKQAAQNGGGGGAGGGPEPGGGASGQALPGLLARFYTGRNFLPGDFLLERVDGPVNFDWDAVPLPTGVPTEQFCIRWIGLLRVAKAGHYTLATRSDDGSRLIIDGKVVVDQWQSQAATRVAGDIDLTAGDHTLQLDYFQDTGDASCRLLWSLQNGFDEQPIPLQALWHAPSDLDRLIAGIAHHDLPAVQAALAAMPTLATQTDAAGRSVLDLAAAVGDADIVSFLLANKVDPNKADAQNWRPIHIAAEAGRADVVKLLLENHADPNPAAAPDAQTPLYIAAVYGFTDVAKYLLAGRADPNVATQTGETPLQCAAKNGYTDIVSLLIVAKADVNAKDATGHTALDFALAAGHADVAALLKKYGGTAAAPIAGGHSLTDAPPPSGPVSSLTTTAAAKVDTTLLPAGVQVQTPADYGLTAPDPNATLDPAQAKTFLEACFNGDDAQVQSLIKTNVNLVLARDNSHYDALYMAVHRCHGQVIEELIDLGVPPDRPEIANKRTALHRACEFGNLEAAQVLLAHGADIERRDDRGWTPLQYACKNADTPNFQPLIEFLLKMHADPTVKNQDGDTSYTLAKTFDRPLALQTLEAHGIHQ
ncbi:MAG: ankyrin repeat domain-containing protein [Planctomycetota bacterium]